MSVFAEEALKTRRLTFLYGSETGTAEDVALGMYQAAVGFGFTNVHLNTLDSYDIAHLPSADVVIFIVATAGDGEVPGNMRKFWKFLLQKSLAKDCLQNVSTAVFGLGDTSYEKFNAAARKLNARLKQLGSMEVLPLGVGDDSAAYSYLPSLDEWVSSLFGKLAGVTKMPESSPSSSSSSVEMYTVETSNATSVILEHQSRGFGYSFPNPDKCKSYLQRPLELRTKLNKRITNATWNQDVRHIEFEVNREELAKQLLEQGNGTTEPTSAMYSVGDVGVIYPHNMPSYIARMLRLIQQQDATIVESTWLRIRRTNADDLRCIYLPCQIANGECSVSELLTRILDIQGTPRRRFFSLLSKYAIEEEERDKLVELSAAEGTDLYYDYCLREKRNYVEILEDFKSARPPLKALLEMIPLLQPRQYSIASSPLAHPGELHFCVAVEKKRTRRGRMHAGLCSTYLSALREGDMVSLWIKDGSYRIPPVDVPSLFVGPGTGIAPIRGIVHERVAECARAARIHDSATPGTGSNVSTVMVFFGCRKQGEDYLYGEEWSGLAGSESTLAINDPSDHPTGSRAVSSDHISHGAEAIHSKTYSFIPAFSQDQEEKVYVTHKIREHSAAVYEVLSKGGNIFIAGSAKNMPKDVRKAIVDVVVKHADVSIESADMMLKRMEARGMYLVEAWS
jgi:sulfite reductase alpha subunit-like flavoprotein